MSSLAISVVSISGKYLSDVNVCPFELPLSRMIGQLFFSSIIAISSFVAQKNNNNNSINDNKTITNYNCINTNDTINNNIDNINNGSFFKFIGFVILN